MTDGDAIDVLLVEDNPGDVRLIEEMFRDAAPLRQRIDSDESDGVGSRLHHESTLSDGLERLSEVDVDVILLDLGLPDSTGLDTLSAVTDATAFVPVIVFTGLEDEAVGVRAIQQGAQDYLVKDEVTSNLLIRSIHYALERSRQEQERARRREELEALARLDRIVQDVSHAVITTSTREELEQAVCDRLVESDAYRFAWIGEVDRATDQVHPRVAAGVEEGYLEEITITVDDSDTAAGPTGRAVRDRSVAVVQNAQTAPEFEPWREEAIERGYHSTVSVPIVHEGVVYGILNLYASSPNAFSEREADILSRMGDVVGHAITAIERKEALTSDQVLELEFETSDVADELVSLTADDDRSLVVHTLVGTDDGLIAYGRARRIPRSKFEEMVADVSLVEDVRILTSGEDSFEFELRIGTDGAFVDAVATHGGRITTVIVADGALRFVVEFPPGRDKRQLVELVKEQCTGSRNVAQRIVERTREDVSDFDSVFRDKLTDKQRTALEAAYHAGLYDWPRKSTGQEIADSLGISPPTFNQHVRAAERTFFEAVFEREQPMED